MKNTICLVCFLMFLSFAFSCKEDKYKISIEQVPTFTDSVMKIVKTNSIYTDSLDWGNISKEIKRLSFQPSTRSSIVVKYLIKRLRSVGDIHSFYLPKHLAEVMAIKNIADKKPNARYLGDNVGYLFVPAFASTDDNIKFHFAEDIQDLIKSLDKKYDIRKWVIDLRENGGGDMHPMIAGLGPILGNGILGYFISRNGGYTPWLYLNGNTWRMRNINLKVANSYLLKTPNPKVAVLIGPNTKSSGEVIVISFISRGNCKLFGQPTGGFTTGNQLFPLSDGSFICLASSFEADRNKKKYSSKIYPDSIVEPNNKNGDSCLKAAKAWLMK